MIFRVFNQRGEEVEVHLGRCVLAVRGIAGCYSLGVGEWRTHLIAVRDLPFADLQVVLFVCEDFCP